MADEEKLNLEELPADAPPEDDDPMAAAMAGDPMAAAMAAEDPMAAAMDGDPMAVAAAASSGNGEAPESDRTTEGLEAIFDIPVQVSAVLGTATMQVSQLLKLGRGAVVELDRKVGEAVDIYVNNRLVARGEVVIVDERLGVTMTEIIKSDTA
jgi:flagellar motor switch protein FliN/FliY